MKLTLSFFLSTMTPLACLACTTIIVGKNASQDGSVIIARNDDSKAQVGQRFIIHPAHKYLKGQLFRSNANDFSYPMPANALRYSGIPTWNQNKKNLTHEEAGLNSLNIGVSATETIYNSAAALRKDPYVLKTGINEDSIASVLLPRIHSALEGVKLLGKIIENRGTDEGFGVAIADDNNAWYLETASGHQWAAIRIPDDQCFVSANQTRLQKIDITDHKNVLVSPGLIQFAIKNKLFNPKKGTFNFRKSYSKISKGDINYNYSRLATLFKMYSPQTPFNQSAGVFPTTFRPQKPISVREVMNGLQNYYNLSKNDPYTYQNPSQPWRPISVFRTINSHVIAIHRNLPAAVAGVEYLALGMSNLSLYVPFFSGLTVSPSAYQVGKNQADNHSAYWTFRKMQTLTMQNFPLFAPIVHNELKRMQMTLIREASQFQHHYSNKIQTTSIESFTHTVSQQALHTAETLQNKILTTMTKNTDAKYRYEGA